MGDPRGWEALTQQEAEQDARGRRDLVAAMRERDEAVATLARCEMALWTTDRDAFKAYARSLKDHPVALMGENATEGET